MLDTAAGKAATATETTVVSASVLRKIWLPKLVYDALPFFYLVAGAAALVTTLYIHHWAWIVPHYLLFSVACAHFGLVVLRRRHKARQS